MRSPPADCRSALKTTSSGSCWFRDEAAHDCAIHRSIGQESLPSACRQFPRICVLEPHQVSLSLSHYCPTAAGLLFRDMDLFALVDNPLSFPRSWPFEGLDARRAYSPFLRPGVLLGFEALRAFEDGAVTVLAKGDVWSALGRLAVAAQHLARWTPNRGATLGAVLESFASPVAPTPMPQDWPDPRRVLLASVPEGDAPEEGLPEGGVRAEAPSPIIDLVLRRYLAARLIAGWIVFQGDSLQTVIRYLRLCLDTVFVFERSRPPEESELTRWKESIRTADLWLLHHCDPDLLASNLR